MERWLSPPKLLYPLIVNVNSEYSDALGCHDGRGAEANVTETNESDSIGRACHTMFSLQGAYIVETGIGL